MAQNMLETLNTDLDPSSLIMEQTTAQINSSILSTEYAAPDDLITDRRMNATI